MKKNLFQKIAAVLTLTVVLSTVPPVSVNAAVSPAQAIAKGVDVSKYQGVIDWNAVASQGYTFAFIKIGSAKSGLDPTFAPNMLMASAAGLRTGGYIYSYATTVEGAVAEATFAISALANMPVSFPVVFDIEDTVHKPLNPMQQQELVNAFCTVLENEGYYPMVYASKSWFLSRLGPTMYDQWVAQYAEACDYPLPFAVWQATNQGGVPGISGNVDINYLYKDYSQEIIPYGWVNRKGYNYFYENWHMKRGWINYADALWYTDQMGRMVTGWQDLEENGQKRYFTPTGPMAVGIFPVDGNTYYFAPDGVMQTGWQTIGGFRYLLSPEGIMQFGWYQAPEGKYYFADTGAMSTGWVGIGDKTYHFDEEKGLLSTYTFITTGGARFFVDVDGTMVKGFKNIDGATYYFGADGAMQTGWQTIDGKFYHFDETNGVMSVNTLVTTGGITFCVGMDGTRQTGWQNLNGVMYYFKEDGSLAVNVTLNIDGIDYMFDENGIGMPLIAPILPQQ